MMVLALGIRMLTYVRHVYREFNANADRAAKLHVNEVREIKHRAEWPPFLRLQSDGSKDGSGTGSGWILMGSSDCSDTAEEAWDILAIGSAIHSPNATVVQTELEGMTNGVRFVLQQLRGVSGVP